MNKSEAIRSALKSILQQKKLPLVISTFSRTQLGNNIVLKPLVKQFATNRYKIFLENIRQFLGSQMVQINEIFQFAEKLFKVIANDIIVLEANESVRQQSVNNQKKLIQLDKELSALKIQLIANTEEIRTFDEMVEFTGEVLASYNRRLNQCKDIYGKMQKIEISTTLEIETIYDPNVTDEFYEKYHSQLTNVLGRMKRTLESLVEQIKVANNIDRALRCQNFLVNSRNLILELESFLVDRNCVFNKLLSYIISVHKRNLNQLLEKGTDKVKLNTIVYEVIEKNFYMFKLLDEDILKIENQLQNCRKEVESKFKSKNYTEANKLAKQYSRQTVLHYQTIKDIRAFISNIDDQYMKYLTRTQFNVKMKKTNDVKHKIKEFERYINSLAQLGQNDALLKEREAQLKKDGETLSGKVTIYTSKLEPFTEDIFKTMYTDIQEKLIKISSIQESLKAFNNDQSSELKKKYIKEKLSIFTNLQESFFRTQKGLIFLIKEYQKGYEEETLRNMNNANSVILKCGECLQKLEPAIEANIQTWIKRVKDDPSTRQIRFLKLIVPAQGQIHRQRKSLQDKGLFDDAESLRKKEQALSELARMKINFEALIRCYDTLICKDILKSISQNFSFQPTQDLKKEIEQNQLFLQQIKAYYKQLQENQKTEIKNSLFPKVQEINRERLKVMDEVIATFSCIFDVYAKRKSKPKPEELQSGYVQVGNPKILEYLTLEYLARKELMNRIKEVNQKPNLHSKTKQFLEVVIADILSPLQIKTRMDQLEKYIRCLERTMDFRSTVQSLINQLIKKVENPKDELYKGRVIGMADQFVELKRTIDDLDSLEEGPLGKMSFGGLKNEFKKVNDYFLLSEQIMAEKNVEKMTLELDLKDQKVKDLRNRIVQMLGS